MFYYGGLALGRLVSGIIGERWHSWKVVRIGQCILGTGILILMIPGHAAFAAAGLFLIGFGNGPIFPNLLYLTPIAFGEERSTAIIGTQMAISSPSSMTAPSLCGLIGQKMGMWTLPFYLLVFFLVMLICGFRANTVLWKTEKRS